MDKPSFEAISANAGARDGLRIVARTLCPARAKANAASKPIPLLVPVIKIVANVVPSTSRMTANYAAIQHGPCGFGKNTPVPPTCARYQR